MELADRISELLHQAGALMPLEQLGRNLDVLEPDAGHEPLRAILSSRPDRFIVLERPALFAGAEHWPHDEQVAYAEALRAAGFETQALVGATPAAGAEVQDALPDCPLAEVATSLARIAEASSPDGLLRESLWDALPLAEATMRVLAQAWQARGVAQPEESPTDRRG